MAISRGSPSSDLRDIKTQEAAGTCAYQLATCEELDVVGGLLKVPVVISQSCLFTQPRVLTSSP